ncbi:MarR family winged helix-turn-helix transcriptional regulator [Nocardiopsis coralliicola]
MEQSDRPASGPGRAAEERGPAGERDEILARIRDAGRGMSDAAVLFHTALSSRLGMGASDWKVMGLVQAHGPLTAGELVRRSGLKPASITGVLDRLEGRGLLRRHRDGADRRRVLVEIGALPQADGAFDGLLRRLDALCSGYSDTELTLIAGFLEESARLQTEATAELEGRPADGG